MLKLAFENCFRNRRRTVITALSVFIASIIVIAVMSFMLTVIGDMMKNEKLYSFGDIRIRNEKYSRYESLMPIQFYISDLEETEEMILSTDGVESTVAITTVPASVYRDGKTKATSVIGSSLSSVFFSDDAIINEGRMPQEGAKEAVVTTHFLSEFNLSVGDSVTLLFNTTTSASNALKVTITGCVSYLNAEFNSSLVILPLSLLTDTIHMEDGSLEMLVYLTPGSESASVAASLEEKLEGKGLEIKQYRSISTLASMEMIYDVMLVVIIVLFFFIASTLVFNTMMMSVLERKKETATLVALGFSRRSVILLFVLEGAMISLFGSILGAVCGKIIITYFYHYGLDLTLFGADAVEGWSFPSVLHPTLSAGKYVLVTAIETAVAAFSSFLSSVKIRRMEVADTLREEA